MLIGLFSQDQSEITDSNHRLSLYYIMNYKSINIFKYNNLLNMNTCYNVSP